MAELASAYSRIPNARNASGVVADPAGAPVGVRRVAASWARNCQFASHRYMLSRQYGSSSWAVTTGVMPRVTSPRRPSAASSRSTRISGR